MRIILFQLKEISKTLKKIAKDKTNKILLLFNFVAILIAIGALYYTFQQAKISSDALSIADLSMKYSADANKKTEEANQNMINYLNSISKSSGGLKNTFDEVSEKLSTIPKKVDSITISLSKLNSILKEQRLIAEKELKSKIQPQVRYDIISENREVKGIKITNNGEDMEDFKVYKLIFFTGMNLDDVIYVDNTNKNIPYSSYQNINHGESKIITLNPNDLALLKRDYLIHTQSENCGRCIGLMVFRFSYKRPTDQKIFDTDKEFLVLYRTIENNKHICLFTSPKIFQESNLIYEYNEIKDYFDRHPELF
jgi:hypothetical protein